MGGSVDDVRHMIPSVVNGLDFRIQVYARRISHAIDISVSVIVRIGIGAECRDIFSGENSDFSEIGIHSGRKVKPAQEIVTASLFSKREVGSDK